MKKSISLSTVVCIAIILIVSSGCQKFIEYVEIHPTTELPGCQIKQISILQPYGGETDTLTFTYNAWGDPISVIRTKPGTGSPNFFFHYDKKHRLTESVGAYGNTILENGLESWNIYFYDSLDRIIKDSLYIFPELSNGHPIRGLHGTVSIYFFEYDSKDRVSRVVLNMQGAPQPMIDTYSYDEHGNLTGSSYDNKINFRRTNDVWMFMDRNYSVNNALVANYAYNQFGLPTKIDVLPESLYQSFTFSPPNPVSFTNATIEYSCK